jgi:hypothetical protein
VTWAIFRVVDRKRPATPSPGAISIPPPDLRNRRVANQRFARRLPIVEPARLFSLAVVGADFRPPPRGGWNGAGLRALTPGFDCLVAPIDFETAPTFRAARFLRVCSASISALTSLIGKSPKRPASAA